MKTENFEIALKLHNERFTITEQKNLWIGLNLSTAKEMYVGIYEDGTGRQKQFSVPTDQMLRFKMEMIDYCEERLHEIQKQFDNL